MEVSWFSSLQAAFSSQLASCLRLQCLCFLVALAVCANAQNLRSPDGIWTRTGASQKAVSSFQMSRDSTLPYTAVTLDSKRLGEFLEKTPREFTAEAKTNSPTVSVPLPNGKWGLFAIQETTSDQTP